MLSYCWKCRKNTESENPKVVRTINGSIILLSKCSVYNSKKSKLFKEKETKGLLGNWLAANSISKYLISKAENEHNSK